MQKERSVKYDFDFEVLYKKLKKRTVTDFIASSGYYYLTWDDFYHDVLIKAMKYVETHFENTTIDEDTFLSIYWTTAKYRKMQTTNKDKKNSEHKNFKQFSHIQSNEETGKVASKLWYRVESENSVCPVDVDQKMFDSLVSDQFPTIKKVLSGYNFVEGAKEASISPRGYGKRFHKEVEKLKRTNLNYLR